MNRRSFVAGMAQLLPAAVTLREETSGDIDFVAELYASTREEELRPVDWSEAQKRAFLRQQFELQRAHYRQHYAGAQWLIVLRDGMPIGRLYLKAGSVEVRLMDVALVSAQRGQGIGTALMRGVLRYADELGLPVSLHVEPFNPAIRLYERLGFTTRETRGIYCYMERPPAQLNVIS
jgi:ribosomal protein S18 acetylase RimI-like enzyme